MDATERRYISNNMEPRILRGRPVDLLQASLEQVAKQTPPLAHYSIDECGGMFSGYTGLAHLFLQISDLQPDLKVNGHNCMHWARAYLEGTRPLMTLEKGNCGLASEKLSFDTVKACVSGDSGDVIEFLSSIPTLLGPYADPDHDPFPSGLAYGRAGALYMLRAVQHWVPTSRTLIESPMRRLVLKIVATNDDGGCRWTWNGKRYFGACHGEMGIITQLVLSAPSLAPQFEDRIVELLGYQLEDGNWPSSERRWLDGNNVGLIQWCHGASGFVHSLQALQPHFPQLHTRIEGAMSRARDLIWRHGLLTKEPNLCHGIFGNALALPLGSQREHFLALATFEAVEKVKGYDPSVFRTASYGKASAVLMNYWSSAAWTWAVCDQSVPPFIMYTDV